MKPEIKKRWVKALRSGEYEQGKLGLKSVKTNGKESFCCLGVLCDLYSKDNDVPWIRRHDAFNTLSILGHTGTLPDEVIAWAGIGSNNPTVGGYSLAHHNDVMNASFPEIADRIEKHL